MTQHAVVPRTEWLAARQALLKAEKAWTRERDRLAAQRQALPWVKVDKTYVFEGPEGPVTLAQLFDGRSQLIVYHFMFGPDWNEGCPGCSFLADHVDGARQHFEHNDVSFVAVSRGPLDKILAYRERMGWKFRWVSSLNNDFNFDYGVSFDEAHMGPDTTYNFEKRESREPGEAPGISVFHQDADGTIFHTYSSYARGGEVLIGAYDFIDLTPIGRNEGDSIMGHWMRRHDRYETDGRTRPVV
jgi:predicted dithiol-disulfide oxidoreductase (DUF899 family)